ncbi:MAG: hypothetical protein U0841_30050 [Chloroflexia bacterium]
MGGWGAAKGVDYAYLARRAQSARQQEAEFGLAVELLAIGAEFVYDGARLAAALRAGWKAMRAISCRSAILMY